MVENSSTNDVHLVRLVLSSPKFDPCTQSPPAPALDNQVPANIPLIDRPSQFKVSPIPSASIQETHFVVENALQSSFRSAVDWRPFLRSLSQLLGVRKCFGKLLQSTVHNVLLFSEGLSEFDLVVVEQGFVGNNDERDAGAESIED